MPVSWPTKANRWWPSAAISETRSPARVPVSYPSSGLSESPMPRWSTAITRKSLASAGITRRQAYQVWGQPCTSSRGGPSPPDALDVGSALPDDHVAGGGGDRAGDPPARQAPPDEGALVVQAP